MDEKIADRSNAVMDQNFPNVRSIPGVAVTYLAFKAITKKQLQISALNVHLSLLQGSNYNFLSKIVNTVTVNDVTMNTVKLLVGLVIVLTKKVIYFTSLIRIQKYGENVV